MNEYPPHLLKLIEMLKRFPGVGNKSAERYAFEMIEWDEKHLSEMATVIADVPLKIESCNECGCLKSAKECRFCTDDRKKSKTLCIIATAKDAFAIEKTREFYGLYHVLGALLSPLDGIGPDQLSLFELKKRIQEFAIEEIVIALDSTLEGDTTALFLKKEFKDSPIKISRLAFGIPMGSSLDFVDGGTLARAMQGREVF